MSLVQTNRVSFRSMRQEERMNALRAFMKKRETVEEIPESSGQVVLHLSNLSGMWTSRVAVALPISATFSIFLLTSPTRRVFLLYFGGAILYFSLCWLIPHLLAKYHYLPLKVRGVAEWERDFVYWFTGSEGIRASEVPEDVLEQVFSVEPGSTGGLAERLLQAKGADSEEAFLLLRARLQHFKRDKELRARKVKLIRDLSGAGACCTAYEYEDQPRGSEWNAFCKDVEGDVKKLHEMTQRLKQQFFPEGFPDDSPPY